MNPHERLRALALIRAAIEDDGASISLMMQEPPTDDIIQQLVCVAASAMETPLGKERAVETIDRWLVLVLAEENTP